MVKKTLISTIGLFLAVGSFTLTAQDLLSSSKEIRLRTNPVALLEKEAGIMLGVNYRWHRRWSFTADPTFIFFTIHRNENGEFDKPLGLKFKADIRYHIHDFILGFSDAFISPEAVFTHVTTYKNTTFGINCVGGNCDYYMHSTYREIKTEKGMAIKIGIEEPISRWTDKWRLELFAGLGISFFKIIEKDIPPNGVFLQPPVYQNGITVIREGEPNITIPAGLKISFRIR